jgi:GNAT superfamily N-acetyltransferase
MAIELSPPLIASEPNAVIGCCRGATIADIPLVAQLHLLAFPGFFLSQLGFRFLCVMYKTFLSNSSGIFIVCESNDFKLLGFAVGALQRGGKDRNLALQFLPQFLWALLPVALCKRGLVLRRLAARFFKVREMPSIPDDALILRSIAVLPALQGLGVASSLLSKFEFFANELGASHIFLTTDEDANDRAQRFYGRHGYVLSSRFQQDGKRWMWLMSKDIKLRS